MRFFLKAYFLGNNKVSVQFLLSNAHTRRLFLSVRVHECGHKRAMVACGGWGTSSDSSPCLPPRLSPGSLSLPTSWPTSSPLSAQLEVGGVGLQRHTTTSGFHACPGFKPSPSCLGSQCFLIRKCAVLL